jgi:predicted transposase YdaD
VTDRNGVSSIVILELQSSWEPDVALQLLDYRTRHILKLGLPALTCVLLLRASNLAHDRYEDAEVQFQYRLIRVFEWDARVILENKIICLAPFTPLMQHGEEVLIQAEELIYNSELSRMDKADLLTSMTILSGLVSPELPVKLLNRRRDIMIESAAYDLIKAEGIQQGMQQGMQQGIQQGMQQGIYHSIRKLLLNGIDPHEVSRLLDVDFQTVLTVVQSLEKEH